MFKKLFAVLFRGKAKSRRFIQVTPSCGPEEGRKLSKYVEEMGRNVRDYLARREKGIIS